MIRLDVLAGEIAFFEVRSAELAPIVLAAERSACATWEHTGHRDRWLSNRTTPGDTMSDFDQEKVTSGRAAPSVAFHRAMTDVETRCNDLATLLSNHNFGQVEYTVRSAADLWLAGRAAYRRLVERDTELSFDVGAARQLLESTYLTLLNLLKRAHTLVDEHSTRSMLDDMRITLVTAMAQPPSDAAETPDAEWSGDTQEMAIDD